MKGVIRSLAQLKADGFEVEVWCWYCDEGLAVDRVYYMPKLGHFRFVGMFVFAWLVNWRAWWLYRVMGVERPDVIYSVAGYLTDCDIAHVHFSPFDWEKRQRLLTMCSLRDVIERALNWLSLIHTRRYLRQTSARKVISVSEAVAADVLRENSALNLHVLPNSYDPGRFNTAVRKAVRSEMRAKLGYEENDCVFIFVSTGHYRRKGFFLAVESLRMLYQAHSNVRFLVVGGSNERLASLKSELGLLPEWMTFTGMVADVESYFAASDAFLFPSYSEAFALVEVEAAASGLPLFLTPHHGSEMILEDGVNGRLLEFDARQICEVLKAFVEKKWVAQEGVHLKRALDMKTYAVQLSKLMSDTVAKF